MVLTNLENLRMRAQVSVDALRWRQSGRNDDYLYAAALPLAKAQDLADRDFLDDAEREFVTASVRAARSTSERKRRNLHRVSAVAVVALALAITSFVQYSRARAARREASQAAQRAKLARTEAEKLINFLVGDLHDKLKPIGKLDLLAEESLETKFKQYGIAAGRCFRSLESGRRSARTRRFCERTRDLRTSAENPA